MVLKPTLNKKVWSLVLINTSLVILSAYFRRWLVPQFGATPSNLRSPYTFHFVIEASEISWSVDCVFCSACKQLTIQTSATVFMALKTNNRSLKSITEWKPIRWEENRCNVFTPVSVCWKAGSSILNQLKVSQKKLVNTSIENIRFVQAPAYKGMNSLLKIRIRK